MKTNQTAKSGNKNEKISDRIREKNETNKKPE